MVQRGTIIEQGLESIYSSLFISSVDLLQQFIGSAEMGDDDAASDDERDIEGFLLFFANGSEAIGLDDVVVDAFVAAQAGGDYQSHELFILGRDGEGRRVMRRGGTQLVGTCVLSLLWPMAV
jgi:hypothetical protein